jgi:hypothetical protein
MRSIAFFALALAAGIEGFALFAPYLLVILIVDQMFMPQLVLARVKR